MNSQDDCVRQLSQLYEQEIEGLVSRGAPGLAEYLRSHSVLASAMLRQIQIVQRYLPYVQGRVLDWGCSHAPDACLLKLLGPPGLELHACDVFVPGIFQVFHGFSQLSYRQIEHPWQLPYPDGFFDTVISDGVLEHVPNDLQSLAEVYRIMKPGGRFIVCCLPNRYSYTEMLARLLKRPHHLRTYAMKEAKSLLLHSGFRVRESAHYQMAPTLSGSSSGHRWLRPLSRLLWTLNPLLERMWPICRTAANLYLVGEKCQAITWTAAEGRNPSAQRAA